MTKKMILSGSELFARAGHTRELAVKRGRVVLALWPAFSRLNRPPWKGKETMNNIADQAGLAGAT